MSKRTVDVPWQHVQANMGEALHTAFRKGSDHPKANEIWHAIRAMPDKEYAKVIDWLLWSFTVGK
jgi:hypothetical protein